MEYLTTFNISKKPGRMAIVVEATAFTLKKFYNKWRAVEYVDFLDDTINVQILAKGQKGEKYKMKMTINDKTKDISGELEMDGKNYIDIDYPASDFFESPLIAAK